MSHRYIVSAKRGSYHCHISGPDEFTEQELTEFCHKTVTEIKSGRYDIRFNEFGIMKGKSDCELQIEILNLSTGEIRVRELIRLRLPGGSARLHL